MRRVPELDGIRGLAVLAVLLYHLRPYYWFLGWAGVDLFFVLSGYLITSIIIRNSESSRFFASFYARRTLRIWPIYYLVLLAIVVTNRFVPQPDEGLGEALPYFLTYTQYIPYYWSDSSPTIRLYVHTWSLAIEEQYYLLWPLLTFRASRRRIAWTAAAFVGVAVAGRAAGFQPMLLLTRCDGLALGSLLATLPDARQASLRGLRLRRVGFVAVGLLATAYLVGGALHFGRGDFLGDEGQRWRAVTLLVLNLAFASCVGLVATDAGRAWLAPLRLRALTYLGSISYGVYLYHWVVYRVVGEFAAENGFDQYPYTLFAVKLGVSIGLAALSWHFIERPILGLKDRFSYASRAGADSPVPAGVQQLARG
jgi:peptidoglycan/LPS O-acetylase OafA/YrhL